MEQDQLIKAAAGGDSQAFDQLTRPLLRMLQSYILRMVANPTDAEDLLQETLAKAYRGLAAFRGDASFKNWVFAIATRTCLDHLRQRKRWRVEAHVEAGEVAEQRPEVLEELFAAAGHPDFVYSVREHVAFCFSCIGRVLSPEEQAAVVLREVLELTNRESAKAMGVSESVFRHRLSAARQMMCDTFENLCALVNKQGICHMCNVLRGKLPPEKRGEKLTRIGDRAGTPDERLDVRLEIVRQADLARGTAAPWHDLMFTMMSRLEESRAAG
jgi:RNA polymerase sigma-70 factor (ECF subfamily)